VTALGVVILEFAACTGLGIAVLTGLRISTHLRTDEKITWAFATGFGLLGWLLFFVGYVEGLRTGVLAGLLATCALGNLLVLTSTGGSWGQAVPRNLGVAGTLAMSGLVIALSFDLAEGLSPPADGDSMTYHFALPKQFLSSKGIFFTPRAADGAVPLLVQMTYVPVLALGGEKALTVWTMISGWMATAFLLVILRRFLEDRWSLAIALVFITTPAVVYGAGSGQVEIRNALFVMLGAAAVCHAVRTGLIRYAVLAGLAAGFFVGAKYLGLLFAVAAGVAILLQRNGLKHGIVFGVATLAAGFQWYFWNWQHTGDPIFPMLYGTVEYTNPDLWNDVYQSGFRSVFETESPAPTNLLWFFGYPFVATFAGLPRFESARTGFGPMIVLMVPFLLAGLWQFRRWVVSHSLFSFGVIVLLFYGFWFFTGSSQRIRHLLPILPLLLVCVSVISHRWAAQHGALAPLAGAIGLTCLIQIGGHGLFALNHGKFLFSDETHQQFLSRNIGAFAAVSWINDNLSPSDRVFTTTRELVYHIDTQIIFGHAQFDARVDVSPLADDPKRLVNQLTRLGVTHYLTDMSAGAVGSESPEPKGLELWRRLIPMGCLVHVREFDTWTIPSRTLFEKTAPDGHIGLYRLEKEGCANSAATGLR